MNKRKEIRKIKTIAQKLARRYSPEKIVLFGSYAWGRPNSNSDFDLLIIKNKKKNFLLEQQKVRHILQGEVAADILIHTPQEIRRRVNLGDFFYQDILQKGIVLYDKSK